MSTREGNKYPGSLPSRLPGGSRHHRDDTVRNMLLGSEALLKRATDSFVLSLDKLVPNPNQPRQVYNEEQEAELVSSIRENGVLVPLLVRKLSESGMYQIVAGERRYRASKEAGLTEVPVIIHDYTDEEARIVSLLENLQRADLDPRDEQQYFQQLQNEYNLSILDISKMIHKSPKYVRNRLEGKLEAFRPESMSPQFEEATTAPNGDENHNKGSEPLLIENSQSLLGEASSKTKQDKKVVKLTQGTFKRFTKTLDMALLVIEEGPPDEATRIQLDETLNQLEQKITKIRQRLSGQ